MTSRTLSQSGGMSGWYTQSYARPFPTGRLRAPSLLPGSRNPLPVTVQQTLVVDLTHNAANNGENKEDGSNVRRRETIFGPDVGEDDEPGWTDEKKEEVSVDVVKGWVDKAKNEEGLHPTTTLQALVNLKRPTLLLQQLEVEASTRPSIESESAIGESEISPASPSRPNSYIPSLPLHVLKFNYDATTPQVRISLEIYPTPQPPIEGKESIVDDHEPKIVYQGLHPGGFNQVFNLPPSAALDLSGAITQTSDDTADVQNGEKKLEAGAGSQDPASQTLAQDVPEVPSAAQEGQTGGRRRFGLFRRNREEDLEAGAAGAQIEMTNTGINGVNGTEGGSEKEKQQKKEIEQGLRLLIRIDGVGPEGQALKRRNAQLTHILINGTWVPETGSAASGNQAGGKRVWVIKVARREAVIGAHTFLLKEIYGLSATSASTAPTAYPPTSDDPYASTPNECIVCLTSPRDVVLLPCRHLVVCRDCAVGMVEFGAGGKVARREDGETGATGTGAGGGEGGAEAGSAAPAVAGGTTTTGRERRKKKVKGWYCPVCRQPYTSLLRLALPESDKPPASGGTRPPSRAASIRTFRSGRAPSIAPTLPDGAERMLESLRPAGVRDADNDVSDDEVGEHDHTHEHHQVERPQFVLGEEVEPHVGHAHTTEQEASDEKDEVEYRENASVGVTSTEVKEDVKPKGWKEVS
ncbi:hypothetical protein IAR55_002730 [Kwoniella newhampshirensis]|uniref:RING-type domain-containing protein n=1 Tax=Kwoniella newhampshirensis TaxID=1651941 RepID=A0AAW0YZT0_9TREE